MTAPLSGLHENDDILIERVQKTHEALYRKSLEPTAK